MLKNYLTITLRHMARNRLFTIINIVGISVSLACCILLFFYGTRELSFDSHHGEHVYRLVSTMSLSDGQSLKVATNSVPIAYTFHKEIPEVEMAARATTSALAGGKNVIRYEDKSWTIEDGFIADTSLFKVLNFHILHGNPDQPLSHHNGIAFDQEWAEIIFGSTDPVGEIIQLQGDFGNADFEVTSVYDNRFFNSHLNPSFIVSMANSQWDDFFNRDMTNWIGNNMVYTYLKIQPMADISDTEKKMQAILMENGGKTMKEMGVSKELFLQPVSDIHTSEGFMANVPGTTNVLFIQILILIGILILILACVNYINLATAQGGQRALEVGIRKVMGVTSRDLILQFIGESFMIVFISLLLSILFSYLALPVFNQLIDNPLHFSAKYYPILGAYLLGFWIITGLIAGFYPAFYLSSFKPTSVIKGRGKDHKGTSFLRQGLVVFQFIISISLISSIMVISQQVNYIKNKDLGFNAESIVILPLNTQEASGQYNVLKDAYGSSSMIQQVTGSDGIPGSPIINDLLLYKKGQTMDDAIHIYNTNVDLDFTKLLHMKILSGSPFMDYNKDSTRNKILISETGANMLGFSPEEAPGEMAYFEFEGNKFEYEIVGVVNDVHQFSLHNIIDPMMYTIGSGQRYQYMLLKTSVVDFQILISYLEKEWDKVIKETPFSYIVLDDHLLLQYESDFNTFNMIKYFAFISIIISVLGLYAMSMFLAERRFKEIGIRKTFGAEVRNIILLVTTDLTKLILIAYIVSIPVSIFAMNKWLNTFAYKINQGAEVYLLAGVFSLLIAWLTISYQSYRAARTNPIEVLREE